jgi:5'(3')-deoxyribonucleotidase
LKFVKEIWLPKRWAIKQSSSTKKILQKIKQLGIPVQFVTKDISETRKNEIDSKFYDLTETREGALNWLKSYLPNWPEYVLRDWLYRGLTAKEHNPPEHPKEVVDRSIAGEGMSAQTQWKLIPNFEFKIEKLHPDTQRRINIRAGGSANPMNVPKDAERHATQAALAQQQGGVRKEPVIGKMTPQGFELIEGWHRTIQHFKQFPNGYRGPAWVAMNAVSESISEAKVKLYTDPDYFGADVDDSVGDGLPVVNIPLDKLVGFEPDSKMKDAQSAMSMKNMTDVIKAGQGKDLPPIFVRKYKGSYQVLDGHHRFHAFKAAGAKTIPAKIIPDSEIEEFDRAPKDATYTESWSPMELAIMEGGHLLDEHDESLEETLKKVKGKWALVSRRNPKKVLQYYKGSGHPSKEWVSKVERRVHSFESIMEDDAKPRVYLDMDGVLADFFGEWSRISNVDHYKDINDVEAKLQLVRDHPTFWIDLPLLPHAKALIKSVVEQYGEYRICSKPLEGDTRSKPGKMEWIKKHLSDMPPAEVVLTADKAKFATHEGAPNILVDDFGVNINSWRAAGGIGIKYEDSAFPQVAKILSSIAKSGVSK